MPELNYSENRFHVSMPCVRDKAENDSKKTRKKGRKFDGRRFFPANRNRFSRKTQKPPRERTAKLRQKAIKMKRMTNKKKTQKEETKKRKKTRIFVTEESTRRKKMYFGWKSHATLMFFSLRLFLTAFHSLVRLSHTKRENNWKCGKNSSVWIE